MLKYHLALFLFILTTGAFSQSLISGKVTDQQGNAIPFVSVYVKDYSISTVANEKGEYRLNLKPGFYNLIFRYVGYKQQERKIDLKDFRFIDIRLEPEVLQLNEVKIVSYNKDLAEAVIRKIIARRKIFLRQSSFFSSDVYTKSVQKLVHAPKKFLGEDVAKALSLDSNGQSILYQSETHSKLYTKGTKTKEVMLASKIAGDKQGFSFNRALDLQVNFYNNLLQWSALSKQSFVSPVADNAFSYYNYAFSGTSEINGKTVYKIKVIPRHKFDPVFRGYLYVLKDEWRLYSVDLELTKDARIDFVDTMKISQQFIELEKKVWQPSDITFRFKGKVLGFEFAGYLIGVYSNYVLNPKISDTFFNDEILKITEEVNKKDNAFWQSNRPVPLTYEEDLNYRFKDSLEVKRQSKSYLDSIQRNRNKFKPLRFLIAGYRMDNLYRKSSWYFYSLNNAVFYNTIEGWGVNLRARYSKQYSYKRWLEFEPNFRYGFSSKTMNANAEVTYQYDTLNHASVSFKGGSDFLDLNSRGTINLFYNTLSTLFKGKNYLKLYRAHFASFRTQREIVDGLQLTAGAEIARRFPVMNRSYKPIFDNAKSTLTSNNPLMPTADIDLFPINNAFTFEAKASYTYGQKYTTKPDGKVYETAKYPTLQVNFRKGIPNIMHSVVDYEFLALDLFQDKIRMGLMGYSSFYLSAGKFLNTKSLFFPDIHHFTGNQTAIYNPLFPNFHFLDYYAFSTNNKYLEGHYEHNFSGLFLSKVPLIRKLKIEEIIGGAFLNEPLRNYHEVYIGFQRLVFRIDYGFSWSTGREMSNSFRIFYGF